MVNKPTWHSNGRNMYFYQFLLLKYKLSIVQVEGIGLWTHRTRTLNILFSSVKTLTLTIIVDTTLRPYLSWTGSLGVTFYGGCIREE